MYHFQEAPPLLCHLKNNIKIKLSSIFQGEFTGAVVLGVWVMTRRVKLPPRARIAAHALAGMALVQVGGAYDSSSSLS